LILILFFLISALDSVAQHPVYSKRDSIVIDNGDTIPHFNLSTVYIFPVKKFRSWSEEQQYWRLVMRVKKVLPYAREAAVLLKKYEMEVPPDARNKDRREYVRKAEKELMKK